LYLRTLKAVLGYSTSACQTHCVLELLGPLSITLLSANISWDSSLGKISCVHVACILWKQEDTYYMNVVSSTNTGILEGTLLLTLLYFSNLILVLFISNLSLIISSMVSTTMWFQILFIYFSFFSFSFSVSFFFSFFFTSCCFCLHVCSYEVATMVCLHALCNKLLILKNKKKATE